MLKWYPVECKKGQEFRATSKLNERYSGRCHCPVRYDFRKREIALWTNYSLIELELGEDDIHPIRSTPGVNKGLLRFGDHYPHIPAEIAKAAINAPVPYEQAKQIRVLSGSFEHLILELESADEKTIKAWVNILGKPQLVDFEYDRVILI